ECDAFVGVVVSPPGFDARAELLGLDLLTRHLLALQSAGCDTLTVLGEEGPLPRDARLRVPVSRDIAPHARALIVRADVTSHRSVPPRMAKEAELGPGEVVRAGGDEAALFLSASARTAEVVEALGAS